MNTRKLAGAVTLVVFLALVTVAIVTGDDGSQGPKVPPGLAPATIIERGAPAIVEPEPAPPPPVPPCATDAGADPSTVVCGPVEQAGPPAGERRALQQRTGAREVEHTEGAVSTTTATVPADEPRPGVRSSDERRADGAGRGRTERTHPRRNQTTTTTVQRS